MYRVYTDVGVWFFFFFFVSSAHVKEGVTQPSGSTTIAMYGYFYVANHVHHSYSFFVLYTDLCGDGIEIKLFGR